MRTRILRSLKTHRWLVFILAAFVALGVTYSIVTPIFEAGDELWHYPFVQYLATGHGLPIQDPNMETLWEQEGGQPPLYYTLGALATFWIDTRDLPDRLWRNPHAKIGIPLAFGNKNMVVHTSAEDFPWHNTALAVHLIRFLSLILSTITVALTYFLALEFKDDKTLAAIAAAIVAFNPMFLFISASVNNDTLATLLATLALLLLTQLVTRSATLSRFGFLGIVLGLGALTKISNLGLLGVAACVFVHLLWHAWKSQRHADKEKGRQGDDHLVALSPRYLVISMLLSAAIVVIAFWWYVRNWILYGDLLALNAWVQIAGGRPMPATLATLLNEFQGFRISFWGNFGGVNLIASDWVYTILDAFTVLAAIGLLIGLARRALPRLLWIPALWLVVISISLVRWTLLTLASQGRLIFPAISAVAILMAYGLSQFQISDFRLQIARHASRVTPHVLLLVFSLFLLVFAFLAPWTIITPAYTLPPRFTSDIVVPNPTHIIFDNQAELVGYDLPQKSVAPGNELPLTLYWRTQSRIAEDFSMNISALDATGKKVGQWDAFPGNGMYPTRLWQPGEVIQDRYRVPIAFDASAPGMAQIQVTLFRRVPLGTLDARDQQGRTITPAIERFKIAAPIPASAVAPKSRDANFGDKMLLVGFAFNRQASPGSTLQIKLDWRALAPMTEDYTIFIHLVDADGKIIAQRDDQPQGGAYPTSFWDVGEIIVDEYQLAVPRDAPIGEYKMEIGVYLAGNGARLPVRDNDHIVLAGVRVVQ